MTKGRPKFTLGNLASSQGVYERASHAFSQRDYGSDGAPQDRLFPYLSFYGRLYGGNMCNVKT